MTDCFDNPMDLVGVESVDSSLGAGRREPMTGRESFAGVLVLLVRQSCVASGGPCTSLSRLRAKVPPAERQSVQRGLEALLKHGLLAQSGHQIWLTTEGQLFLGHVRRRRSQMPKMDDDSEPCTVLGAARKAIAMDRRLEPYDSLDTVLTLPQRLEEQARPKDADFWMWWVGVGILIALVSSIALLE
jgi:hypothetical protein